MSRFADRRAENRERLRQIVTTEGCLWCGSKDELVLQWHHLDPRTKSFNVMSMLGKPWYQIELEIAKCVILCCNDHLRVEAGVISEIELIAKEYGIEVHGESTADCVRGHRGTVSSYSDLGEGSAHGAGGS